MRVPLLREDMAEPSAGELEQESTKFYHKTLTTSQPFVSQSRGPQLQPVSNHWVDRGMKHGCSSGPCGLQRESGACW